MIQNIRLILGVCNILQNEGARRFISNRITFEDQTGIALPEKKI